MKASLATIYNVPFICNFEADTDTAALVGAVKKILAAHPSVNVHLELCGEEIMQVVNKNVALLYRIDEEENHFDENRKFFNDLLKNFENASEFSSRCALHLQSQSSGRGNVKFADTFGMFVNTLPLAADYSFAPKIMYEYQVGVVEEHKILNFTGV